MKGKQGYKPGKIIMKKHSSRHKKRMLALQVGGLAALGLVILRIANIQHAMGHELLTAAAKVQDVSKVELAPRGEILDSAGQPIAYDVPAYMMDIKISDFSNKKALAQNLSKILNLPYSQIYPLIAQKYDWIQWNQPILATAKDAIEKLYGNGKHATDFSFTATEKRFYPFGSFAAATVGYVGPNGQGVMGIEAEENKLLEGTPGKIVYKQDALGFPLPGTVHTLVAPKPGDSVELTINPVIQGFVDHVMKNLNAKLHPEHATMIVMDPWNGQILAMSNQPDFNPNHYWTATSNALDQNWGVSAAFEPGSTFKLFVLTAALATHSINLNQTYMSGKITIDGRTIHDWNYWGWGRISFLKALEYSSNVGFAKIAMRVGWSNLMHYLRLFGLTQPTGIDLPDEGDSILFPPSQEGKIELATTGFGQGIAVTPIQLVDGVSAIANGGTLYRPYVVQKIISPQGKVIKTIEPHVVRRDIAPASVLATVRHGMILDVSQGIDNAAYIKGYEIAGKTGTAQVVNPKTGKFYSSRFITSFVGFAPGWAPKVVIYCAVDWPKLPVNDTWGSTTATPAVRQVMKDLMNYYGIAPRTATSAQTSMLTHPAQKTVYIQNLPSLIGDSVQEAQKVAHGLAGSLVVNGNGSTILRQWPLAGSSVQASQPIYVWTSTGRTQEKMPSIRGLTLTPLLQLLHDFGLHPIISGSGFVVGSSIAAGQPVYPGEQVHVSLQAPTLS
ncbi:penicillin-binding transpeptidase domain-containing protein [Alicyclobacillus tolerans]|uniref:Cell division protein FtsI/penicillin-binding protein 2 n=1 Tax=Alicyclobacillus tolerans TaxID=90970 RepID=A0ABT9LTW2_9BACL|nr:penicillin-binding transpeptidase domain-containing protein [Alicyclobacillus tengchongensis]MDP9727706.1 cell division protein FtsI/penicillin-binding protein 2 [Alicyclobacillus tengchongensis]